MTTETANRNGYLLLELARAALAGIETNREQLNALNVFPVPDGDTGTNMMLTMRGIVEQMDRAATADVPATSEAMARAAVLEGRGNSGLIMAQLFRGMRDAMTSASEVDQNNFAQGISLAAKMAYEAVPNPVEGTMLTVLRETGDTAVQAAESGTPLEDLLDTAAAQAMDTVERTPQMLEVLAEAGVVDAGGFGLAIMLTGMSNYLRGEGDGAIAVSAPGMDGSFQGEGSVVVHADSVHMAEEEAWGYCTSFAIEGQSFDVAELRESFSDIGRSTVITGDINLVKVHVHMEDPGEALSLAHRLGIISNVSIQNMDAQATEWAENRRADAAQSVAPTLEPVGVAVVAVAVGAGMIEHFREISDGACVIVMGGDTLNPSVADLLEAVEAAPSQNVIILPNNKNIIGAAQQAVELTDKSAHVIATRSMQEGFAALDPFDCDGDMDELIEEMEDMIQGLHVGAVFRASREATMNSVHVQQGQFMVTVDGEAVGASDNDFDALLTGVKSTMHNGALVSVYLGEDVAADAIEETEERIEAELSDYNRVELHVVRGDQPHYSYLFAVE